MNKFTERRFAAKPTFEPEDIEALAALLAENDPHFGIYVREHWRGVVRDTVLPWIAENLSPEPHVSGRGDER